MWLLYLCLKNVKYKDCNANQTSSVIKNIYSQTFYFTDIKYENATLKPNYFLK